MIRALRILSLMIVTTSVAVAQVVQFTHDPEQTFVPTEIRIQSSGTIDTTTLVVWGSTVREADSSVRNVLVYQMVRGTTPIDTARVLTGSSEQPYGFVHVIALYDRFLVFWNDKRPTQSGLYRRTIDASGVILDSESRHIDTIAASSVELYGALSSGNAALGWNDAGKAFSRLRRLDASGELTGPLIRIPSTIVGSWPMPRGWDGTVVQMKDGSGIITGSERTPSDRWISPGVLNAQLIVGEDSTVWVVSGNVRHIRRLWDPTTIATIAIPPLPGLSGSVIFSRSSTEEYRFHYLTQHDTLYYQSQYSSEWRRRYRVDLHTMIYGDDGTFLRHDTEIVDQGEYRKYYYTGDLIVQKRAYLASRWGNSCEAKRSIIYSWALETSNDEIVDVSYDTAEIHLHVDPSTGNLVVGPVPECRLPTAGQVSRRNDKSISATLSRGSVTLFHQPASNRPPVHNAWLGVYAVDDQIHLASHPAPFNSTLIGMTSVRVTDAANGIVEQSGSFGLNDLSPYGESYHTTLNFAKSGKVVAVRSLGRFAVVEASQWREDHWRPYYQGETPVYKTSKANYLLHTRKGWVQPGSPLNEFLIRYSKYDGTRFIDHSTRDPNREMLLVMAYDSEKWNVHSIDSSGTSLSVIPIALPSTAQISITKTQFHLISGNADTLLFITPDSLYIYKANRLIGSSPLSRSLDYPRCQRLYGNVFVRSGFVDDSTYLLETYDLRGALTQSTTLHDLHVSDSLFLLSGVGDSAIVLLRGNREGSDLHLFNQQLRQTGPSVRIADAPVTGTICAAVANDSCYIFWVGPSNGATDVFGRALAMPPIPDVFTAVHDTSTPDIDEPPIVEEEPALGEQVRPPVISPYDDIVTLTPIPNPASASVELGIRLTHPWPVTITLADERGRVVLRREALASVAGENVFTLEVGELMPGAYTVVMEAGTAREEGALLIVR